MQQRYSSEDIQRLAAEIGNDIARRMGQTLNPALLFRWKCTGDFECTTKFTCSTFSGLVDPGLSMAQRGAGSE